MMSISGVIKVGGGAEEARAAAGALEEPAEASRDGPGVEEVETRAETPSVEEDCEVEVVPRQQPRIVLRAARSARPREQAPPMRLIDYWGTARFGHATNSGARQAATSVTGARQGSFENGGCCISAAPGEDARFKF